MPKVKSAIELLSERVKNIEQPKRFSQTAAANQRAIKIVTHNLKVAFSALITTQVGDKREHLQRAEAFLGYWDDCVRQAALIMRERFPDKQSVSGGELGMLRMAVQPIAKDGYRAGLTPRDAVATALSLPWAEDLQGEHSTQGLPGDTEVVMMNTATGINRLYNAFTAEVLRHDLDQESRALVFGAKRTVKDTVLDVFLNCRNAAAQVTDHVVQDLGGSEVVLSPSTIAAFTSTYIHHVKHLMETSFGRFLKDTEANWEDPMKRHEMMARGALCVWLDGQIKDFSQVCCTVFDSSPNLSATDGYIAAADLSATTTLFEKGLQSIKSVEPQKPVISDDVDEPSAPVLPPKPTRNYNVSFAELLERMETDAPKPTGQP